MPPFSLWHAVDLCYPFSRLKTLLFSVLVMLAASGLKAAESKSVKLSTSVLTNAPGTNDLIEQEFKKLEDEDDTAHAEVDQWIRDNQEFAAKGTGVSAAELNRRIQTRLDAVRKGYQDFIQRHPNYARARVAFASFLGDLNEEEAEQAQLEKALELDPKLPATYNNLANLYGHNGSLSKAFEYYAKAIELSPTESVYYHNLASTVFLFRKDAREYYHLTEQQVFDKALELYAKARKYDPDNFPLASDVAQTYYGIKPMRTEQALTEWTNTLAIAHDELEREGVYIHLARVKLMAGRFDEARAHLNQVTNRAYTELMELRARILRNVDEQEAAAKRGANTPSATNSPASAPKS
jgi:tetratricopeptide (TPR) repeat protein